MVETFWDLSGRPSDCCRLVADAQQSRPSDGSAPKADARRKGGSGTEIAADHPDHPLRLVELVLP